MGKKNVSQPIQNIDRESIIDYANMPQHGVEKHELGSTDRQEELAHR